jgi:hypothetical protein
MPEKLRVLLENNEDRVAEFRQDLEEYVDGNGTSPSLHRSSFALIKSKNTTRTNTLFVLEKFMLILGFIVYDNLTPVASSESYFSQLYTVYDLILVVTFLYVGMVKKCALKAPETRTMEIIGLSKIAQEGAQKMRVENASDGGKTINKIELQMIWMKVEDKMITDMEQAYIQYAFKTTSREGRAELTAYTAARREAFLKWKEQDSDCEESEDKNERNKKARLAYMECIRKGNVPQDRPCQESL